MVGFFKNHVLIYLVCGCPFCQNEKNGNSKRDTLDEFILKSQKIHDYKYSYKIYNYINNDTKLLIMCKKHGIFNQTPTTHLLPYAYVLNVV